MLKTEIHDTIENVFATMKDQHELKHEIMLSILPKLELITERSLSAYKRNMSYLEAPYIKPLKINLGMNNYHKDCFYFYIPVLETLKSLFEDRQIIAQFKLYKNNNCFFNKQKRSIKILVVYYMLGNLEVHNRSQVKNIMLALICTESHVKTFGMGKILERLLCDLKILETEGIESCQDSKLTGSIIACWGDNLGLHQVGGFLENFSLNEYFCRYCHITMTDFKENFRKRKSYRTKISFMEDVNNLKSMNSSRGIKSDSCLNSLDFYHVGNLGLPPCLAHDLYEGIIPFDTCLAIHYFVKNKWFSYDHLNMTLAHLQKALKYNVCFPEIKSSNTKLVGHAVSNFYLLTLIVLQSYNALKIQMTKY